MAIGRERLVYILRKLQTLHENRNERKKEDKCIGLGEKQSIKERAQNKSKQTTTYHHEQPPNLSALGRQSNIQTVRN